MPSRLLSRLVAISISRSASTALIFSATFSSVSSTTGLSDGKSV